jgi:hypothetical protein
MSNNEMILIGDGEAIDLEVFQVDGYGLFNISQDLIISVSIGDAAG